jgi:hypothetical protein
MRSTRIWRAKLDILDCVGDRLSQISLQSTKSDGLRSTRYGTCRQNKNENSLVHNIPWRNQGLPLLFPGFYV